MTTQDLSSLYNRTCLEIFAHSINECSCLGRDKWGATVVDSHHYRLVMGNLIVTSLESGRIWLAVDIQNEREQLSFGGITVWEWTPKFQYVNPPSKCGFYQPLEGKQGTHTKAWSIIQPLHDRYLANVAETYKHLRTSSQKSHSDEALVAIEQSLKITLPRPQYK